MRRRRPAPRPADPEQAKKVLAQRQKARARRMRLTATVATDATTGLPRHGTIEIAANGAITIRLPFRLESPNATLWADWRTKKRDHDTWMTRLRQAIVHAADIRTLAAFRDEPIAALGLSRPTGRRRVSFERHVANHSALIHDDRNLQFCPKHLEDCLTKLGFLRDDNMRFSETPPVTQTVSPDRQDWTVIRIEIPAEVSMPLPTTRTP
ncbi:MAG: hypothetical protein AB7O67_23290 [Vicinamibacterales bacterium]